MRGKRGLRVTVFAVLALGWVALLFLVIFPIVERYLENPSLGG